MDHYQEEQVVEKCRQGDLSAYRMIYDRYEQPLLRTACRVLGQQQDAEDAVQDTFMKLYRGIHGFHRGARFSSYLFRILLNSCTDILRKKKRAVSGAFSFNSIVVPSTACNVSVGASELLLQFNNTSDRQITAVLASADFIFVHSRIPGT